MTNQVAEKVLDSLYRVVVPLPRNPLKEVNCYVLAEDDRWLVIDTGMNRPECREVMTAGLDEIGVDLQKTDFLATHLHADHHGLIPDLLRPGRTASMGAIDAAAMGRAHGGWSEDSPMGVYLRRSGFPPEELAESFKRHPGARFSGSRHIDYAPLDEGDVIEIAGYRFEVIDTPGHTFGHISLYDRAKRLFIAGDHILGDITPNIQAWADDHDPLGLYLDSIAKVEALDVDLCLPGHRSLIHDFKGRCRELREHHEVRGQEVVDILRANGGRNAYETAALMTWDIRAKSWEDFPIMQRWFATGEAIAHLRWLEDLGELQREDAGERILYSA